MEVITVVIILIPNSGFRRKRFPDGQNAGGRIEEQEELGVKPDRLNNEIGCARCVLEVHISARRRRSSGCRFEFRLVLAFFICSAFPNRIGAKETGNMLRQRW